MTPLSLGAAPVAGQGGAGAAAPAGNGTGKDSSGFDALLQAPSQPAPRAAAKPAAKPAPETPGPGADDPASTPAATTPAESTETAEAGDEVAAADTTEGRPQADSSEPDELPWPPPGLSGLLPIDVPPPPAAPVDPAALAAVPAADPRMLPASPALPETAPAATPLPQAATPAAAVPTAAQAMPRLEPPSATMASAVEAMAQLAKMESPQLAPRPGAETPLPAMEPSSAATALFGPLLQNLAAVAEARPAPAFPPALSAPADMQAADFDEAIGARVGWLAEQKIGHAHIRVTPNDLGPVEVRLQLEGDRVHASFSSAHADVRHALESSLPKLREMLGEQGLQLAHADVGQQQSGPRAGGDGEGRTAAAGDDADAGAAGMATAGDVHAIRLRGLLDAYA